MKTAFFSAKSHIQDLKRVRAGTYRDTSGGLFLDRNERTVPFSNEIQGELAGRLAQVQFQLYPEIEPFYEKLAAWLGVGKRQLFLTEGVSGAVKSLMEALSRPGENVITPTPTFALYSVYARMWELEYRTVGYRNDYQLNLDQLYAALDDRTILVFLPNPNVPIEGTLQLDEIRALARRCRERGAFLAVDEVYFPFGGPNALPLINEFDNLLVLRSFSKAFGLAGVRLGYIAGPEEVVDYVSRIRTGYETNTLSMEVVSYFLENYRHVEGYIEQVKDGFVYLKERLDEVGLEHDGGRCGNFLYVNLRNPEIIPALARDLRARDIYIREGWPAPFDGGFSITGAPRALLERFWVEFLDVYRTHNGR